MALQDSRILWIFHLEVQTYYKYRAKKIDEKCTHKSVSIANLKPELSKNRNDVQFVPRFNGQELKKAGRFYMLIINIKTGLT